jgi:hypothetical protein
MARHTRKRSRLGAGRISAAPGATPSRASFAPTLEAFLADEGQITIGAIDPIPCAAIAADPHNMLAALIRRPGESLMELIERLDRAVKLALEYDTYTDEINAPSRKPR